MKKIMAVLVCVVIVIAITLAFVWPRLTMEFADSAHYTEKDKREYEYYTPDLLRRMPRISDDYEFSYSRISGPDAIVYGVRFNGSTDTHKIRDYLMSAGYEPQKSCDVEAECWLSSRFKENAVTVYQSAALHLVGVDIYHKLN